MVFESPCALTLPCRFNCFQFLSFVLVSFASILLVDMYLVSEK